MGILKKCLNPLRYRRMKQDAGQEAGRQAGNWIGVGTAIGAALFVLTDEPLWIALGVALGAALDWRKPHQARHEILLDFDI